MEKRWEGEQAVMAIRLNEALRISHIDRSVEGVQKDQCPTSCGLLSTLCFLSRAP
jgi:hypothetical protein